MMSVSERISGLEQLARDLSDPALARLLEDEAVVREFESAFAADQGTAFALAVNSGTSALHAALAGLGVGPGDEVIVPALTASAVPLSAMLCQAVPVLADIDEHLFFDLESVRRRLTDRTRAVIAVHPFGFAGDIERLLQVLDGSPARVIEDCSQAHGATRNGRPVGSWGSVSVFSFAPGKILSTGGGGIVLTNEEEIFRRACAQADAGRDPKGARGVGNNYALSPIQALLGLYRLGEINRLIEERRRNARLVADGLAGLPFTVIDGPPRDGHCYYKLATLLEREMAGQAEAIDALSHRDRLPCHRWIPERFDRRDFFRSYMQGKGRSDEAEDLPVTDDILPRLFLFRTAGEHTRETVHRLTESLRTGLNHQH